ncbi:MAG: CHAD domain-containing protein [Rhodospirillales bacterium]|nr:CHAD domain-containing protein [Rhodospirillales bacterium]
MATRVSKKNRIPPPISSGQTVSEAFGTILRHRFDYMLSWEEAARSWMRIEGVHQTRVSCRGMRSAMRIFRYAIPSRVCKPWADELRWAGGELGLARDLDVFISEALSHLRGRLPLPGERKIKRLAEHHRAQAYEAVNAMLDSDRYNKFKEDYSRWVEAAGWEDWEITNNDRKKEEKQRRRLTENVVPFASKVINKQEQRVLKMGTDMDRDSAEEMHRFRIECKKLRYAAESFTTIFDGMHKYIHHMKGLQDLLGVMNDVAVTNRLLGQILKGEKDSDVLRYAGGVIGWRTRQYHEYKKTFDDHWEEFVYARHPWRNNSALTKKKDGPKRPSVSRNPQPGGVGRNSA